VIGYVPAPLPDELLYSLIAYLAYLYRSLSRTAFLKMLFGVKNVVVTMDFPCHIDAFVERLPPSTLWNAEQIIMSMTLWPLYSPFVSKECAEKALIAMTGNEGRSIYSHLGIHANHRPTRTYLKYCPNCWANHLAANKRIYWRRLFQAIGVYICPVHQVWLEDSEVPVRHGPLSRFASAQELVCKTAARPLDSHRRLDQVLLQIVNDAAWLLAHPTLSAGPRALARCYQLALFQKGFARYPGVIKIAELTDAFEKFFGHETLEFLESLIDRSNPQNWLMRLIRPSSTSNKPPLNHLLMFQFLGYSASEFFNVRWPCLNDPCSASVKQTRELYVWGYWRVDSKENFLCECARLYSNQHQIKPLLKPFPDKSPMNS